MGHNTQAARRTAAEGAVISVKEWNRYLIGNPDVAAAHWKGIRSIENLSNEQERSQFAVMTFNLPKNCEQLHYQYLLGSMEPAMWAGNEWQMRGHLMMPRTMQW